MRRLLWFRRDLRTDDNPLLSLGGDVLPIFIFDTNILEPLPQHDRRVGIIYALVHNLKTALQTIGLDLAVFHGDPEKIIGGLQERFGFDEVCASGDYDAYALERDRRISHILPFHYLHDTYIFKPEEMLKSDGTPFLVFSPFYKEGKKRFSTDHMKQYETAGMRLIKMETALPSLASMGFAAEPTLPASPQTLLEDFAPALADYKQDRDRLDIDGTSHLGVALRFGTLSVRALLRWLAARKREGIDTEPFFRQLVFRDFYAHMLYHFPKLAKENFRYSWGGIEDKTRHAVFCEGRTGFPIVDAGVRELVRTGNMHNRVRMICASFYTKDLLLPWQWGERFFAAHLNDFDAASNILSWQWSAGTGIDPQPYFRVFNPWLQGKKFDPDGAYIKKWCPQLDRIASKHLHDEVWMQANEVTDYPKPIVDHKCAAAIALNHFKQGA